MTTALRHIIARASLILANDWAMSLVLDYLTDERVLAFVDRSTTCGEHSQPVPSEELRHVRALLSGSEERIEPQRRAKYDYSRLVLEGVSNNRQLVPIYCLVCLRSKYGDIPDAGTHIGFLKWSNCMFTTRYTDHQTKFYGCRACSARSCRGGCSMSELTAVELADETYLTAEERAAGKCFKPTTRASPEAKWLLDGCLAAGLRPSECLRLDGFCVTARYGPIAIEYQGIQHYRYPNHFHRTRADFLAQQARDILKKRICLDAGVTLIEIRYTMTYRTREKMRAFLQSQV